MNKQSGFQLIELLTVMMIAAVLLMIALPGSQHLYAKQDGKYLRKTVLGLLAQAQQLALAKKIPIGLCQSQDGLHCSAHVGRELLLFVDQYGHGEIKRSRQVLKRESLPAQGKLSWQFYPHYRHYWQFRGEGDYLADNGKIWWQLDGQSAPQWVIRVNQLGNISESVVNLL